MASTTAQIREAMRAALADPTNGLADEWLQISAYMLALPQPPAIDIRPGGTEFDTAMARGNDDMTFLVRAMVAFNTDQGSQIQLDKAIDATGTSSLKTALEHDKTLGGVVSDVHVKDVSPYKALLIENVPPMIAAEFEVTVYP